MDKICAIFRIIYLLLSSIYTFSNSVYFNAILNLFSVFTGNCRDCSFLPEVCFPVTPEECELSPFTAAICPRTCNQCYDLNDSGKLKYSILIVYYLDDHCETSLEKINKRCIWCWATTESRTQSVYFYSVVIAIAKCTKTKMIHQLITEDCQYKSINSD